MMLKNPSKVNHEEWIIVYFRLDNREQLSKIVSVFKKNILELHQYINGWYFNQYIEPSNPKKEDQYRYKIFIQKKTNAKKENVTELINKITGEIMVEIKNTYKPNPDFDSECIVNYLESRNGILDIDLNLLSTKIRELIEKEIGLKPD